MTDIELVFCKDRGQTDVLVEQLERILRFPHAHDGRCRPHAIACRRDASLAELASAAEIMTFSELVARVANPFVPSR